MKKRSFSPVDEVFRPSLPYVPADELDIVEERDSRRAHIFRWRAFLFCSYLAFAAFFAWRTDWLFDDFAVFISVATLGTVFCVVSGLWKFVGDREGLSAQDMDLFESMSHDYLQRLKDKHLGNRVLMLNLARVQAVRDVYHGDWRAIVQAYNREAAELERRDAQAAAQSFGSFPRG